MAGDWIKMRSDLFTHPKVVRMSSALKADTLRTVGGLMSAWCLFDAHSEDGQLSGYSPDVLDSHLRWTGFSQAMIGVGWLIYDAKTGLSLPEFNTHNGASAKRRAQEADRKRAEREADRKPSASEADKKRTREEKRRVDKKIPHSPQGGGALFNKFFAAYPRKVGEKNAVRAFGKLNADAALVDRMVSALAWQSKSERWTKDGGQFIPNPSTWLNQGRWTDESPDAAAAKPWTDTRTGVEARGIELGLGPWVETEQFPAYKQRVMQAHQQGAH